MSAAERQAVVKKLARYTGLSATAYTLSHMGLDEVQRARISTAYYEAGHMMYIHEGELAQLKQDVAKFIASALAKP